MFKLAAEKLSEVISRLYIEANLFLPEEQLQAFKEVLPQETSPLGREVLGKLIENAEIARRLKIPLCQDTGIVEVFLRLGQEVQISGDIYEAVNQGIRRAVKEEYLRASVVDRPFSERKNTTDNTPAVIYFEWVPGDKVEVSLLIRGGGAENMTRLGMLSPGDGREGIVEFVLEQVLAAGANPCPPLIIGLGIGGTAAKALELSRRVLLRPLGKPNPDPQVAALERELLEKVNSLGIGPLGFGGRITALGVHVETYPTHIACLPVAISFQCHCHRYRKFEFKG